uniref:WD repeat-containing protein 11-like n=1 Tax=Tanacetum cinerariifolium TaxID=118510 RepID=A0A699L905_TANCI|nr:WD repeat-containing protein 11-like [Tanacetum cinerariifolium]
MDHSYQFAQATNRAPAQGFQETELRSLALPFTVLEWTLPTVPRPTQTAASKKSDASVPPDGMASQADSKAVSPDGAQEEFSESFAFALANGALGVFEVHGRRIRDFKYNSDQKHNTHNRMTS